MGELIDGYKASDGKLNINDGYFSLDHRSYQGKPLYWFDFLKNYDFVGIIGRDILFQKSCYISLAEEKLGWYDACPFSPEQELSVCPPYSCSTDYKLAISGVCVNLGHSYFGNGWTGKGFLLDTGNNIGCSVWIAEFKKLTKKKGLPVFIYSKALKNDFQSGFTLLKDFVLGNDHFPDVWVGGGLTYADSTLGTQILGRYEIWFGLSDDGMQMDKVYMKKIGDEKYKKYLADSREESYHQYMPETFGFITDINGIIIRTVEYNDEPVLPEVQCGDKVISCNDIPYKEAQKTMYMYDMLDILFERPDGMQYEVQTKKVSLGK